MRRYFRPLRPSEQHGTSSSSSSSRPPVLPPKRVAVISACDTCRLRKAKCDGARPQCTACATHNRECVYSTRPSESRARAQKRRNEELEWNMRGLEQSHKSLLQLVKALQTKDEDEALEILQRLRKGSRVDEVVDSLQAGEALLHVHTAPETSVKFEFPYRTQIPTALLTPNNPYLTSRMYKSILPMSSESSTSERATNSCYGDMRDAENTPYEPPYLKPYGLAVIIDSRLDKVMPTRWTAVAADDSFLRLLLSLYFQYEHHFFSCFHKDLFLDDMMSGATTFCSELLVNAILALSCNCCRALRGRYEFWNPDRLGYKFFAEARRLWDVRSNNDGDVTTVQAAYTMSVIYNLYAMDKIGVPFGVAAVKLAYRLKLFSSPAEMPNTTQRERQGNIYTAWSLYFWTSLECYQLCLPPFVTDPPACPLPDPNENPGWYSESWVRYSLNKDLHPLNHPHLFKAKCELSVILNQLSVTLFDRAGKTYPVAAKDLKNHLKDLGNWYFFLPPCLSPERIIFPFQLNLHLAYYNATINTCEVADSIRTDDTLESSFKPALAHSTICFESIMRLYYLHHGYEIPDGHMAHNLMVLAYKGLSQRNMPSKLYKSVNAEPNSVAEARSTLILAQKGLHDQGKNYFLPWALFQIVEQEMRPEDRDALYESVMILKEQSEALKLREKYMSSQYPVGLDKLDEPPGGRQLSQLTKGFTELAVSKLRSASSVRDFSK